MTPRPKMLIIDVDVDAPLPFPGQADMMPPVTLSEREVTALRWAQDAGLDVVVLTGADEDAVRRVFANAGLSVTVLGNAGADPRVRINRVLDLCRRRGYTLRNVAVIALRPDDIPLMLEAGIAYALMGDSHVGSVHGVRGAFGTGDVSRFTLRSTSAAADAIFPSRYQGGLASAIDAVVTLLS